MASIRRADWHSLQRITGVQVLRHQCDTDRLLRNSLHNLAMPRCGAVIRSRGGGPGGDGVHMITCLLVVLPTRSEQHHGVLAVGCVSIVAGHHGYVLPGYMIKRP